MRSRKCRSKPEPEVVLVGILVSESTKLRESAQRQWRNVGIAVLRERALTKVQFGWRSHTGSRINSPEVVTRMRETVQSIELGAANGET